MREPKYKIGQKIKTKNKVGIIKSIIMPTKAIYDNKKNTSFAVLNQNGIPKYGIVGSCNTILETEIIEC